MSGDRRQILRSAASRILPSEDGAGALEAGVPEYIEFALAEPYMQRYRRLIEYGLDTLDYLARDARGRVFAECDREDQDAVLSQIQSSNSTADRLFFHKLVMLCLEGFLCDPARGGNRDRLGWSYIGFDPPSRAHRSESTADR